MGDMDVICDFSLNDILFIYLFYLFIYFIFFFFCKFLEQFMSLN